MNERFAIDPESCSNALELKYLLEKFGPYTGRYGIQFPRNWEERIRAHTAEWSDIERTRAMSLLKRAHYSVLREKIPYKTEWCWLKNFERHAAKLDLIRGAVVRPQWEDESRSLWSVHNFDLPPTADEKILARSSEYARVSFGLRAISRELVFVDPYLNLQEKSQRNVIETLLADRCQSASFWVKPGEGRDSPIVVDILREMKRKLRIPGVLQFFAATDWSSEERHHARYLVSIRGAIRFDEGFRERRHGTGYKRVEVSVVGKEIHDDLCRRYLEGEHKLKIETQYSTQPQLQPS